MQQSARAAIEQQMRAVAAEHHRRLAPLRDDLALKDSGLDSLCLAVLMLRLENELGIDAFLESETLDQRVTLAALAGLYQRVLNRAG